MSPITVGLITEGTLDEQVLRQLIAQNAQHLQAGVCYGKRGRDWLGTHLVKFNQASISWPYISLGDLERDECPSTVLRNWYPHGKNPNMLSRIAVPMVESWLLADRNALAQFLGIAVHHIPQSPDNENDPKVVMVNLARRSRLRAIKDDMVPPRYSSGRIGKNYVGRLADFVRHHWQSTRAASHSPSLERSIRAINQFRPTISP